jgi:WD40 repeat protein
MSGFHCKIRLFNTLIAALIVILFSGCKKGLVTIYEPTTDNKMFVYPNKGNTFYLVDYNSYNIIGEIKLKIPNNIYLNGMTLSTNRDYLLFCGIDTSSSTTYKDVFVAYDIYNNKIGDIYYTGLTNTGPERFISGQNKSSPGLIYVYYRDLGFYLLDIFEKKIIKTISVDHAFTFIKEPFHCPYGQRDILLKTDGANAYSEIECYQANTDFSNLQFILNQNNKDSIFVYNIDFSNDNRLLVSYQPSGGNYNTAGYLGIYNLNTKQFTHTSLKLPWSLNGYFITYNENRDELYDIGNKGILYIIDANTYKIKKTIDLSIEGQESPVVLGPDKNIAYVGYPENNLLFVINLDTDKIITKITITSAYNIIIP